MSQIACPGFKGPAVQSGLVWACAIVLLGGVQSFSAKAATLSTSAPGFCGIGKGAAVRQCLEQRLAKSEAQLLKVEMHSLAAIEKWQLNRWCRLGASTAFKTRSASFRLVREGQCGALVPVTKIDEIQAKLRTLRCFLEMNEKRLPSLYAMQKMMQDDLPSPRK